MGKKIRLQYLTDEGLAMLKQSFDDNIQKYIDNDQEYFLNLLKEKEYLLEASYQIEDFSDQLKYDCIKNDDNDFYNIQVVYEAMKELPTYIMMDDCFWAGLTHTIMWDYIQKRRKQEAFASDLKNRRDRIYNSFFTHTKHGKKRGTYVNCVSRLWWAGYLTYDETNNDNHFVLTKEVCTTGFASTILLLSSSNLLSKKEAMKALLSTVKKLRDNNKNVSRNDLVAGIRYLNLVAGVTLMDIMSKEDIEEMLMGFYEAYYNK